MSKKPLSKKTKIVCTIGPSSSSLKVLEKMILAGMNVARFNFSHGSHESNAALLQNVRAAARKTGVPVALLLDLQGPKVRIGELPAEGIALEEGKTVTLITGTTVSKNGSIPVPYSQVSKSIKKGDLILLDDGTKELEVISVNRKEIKARVLLGGILLSKKGLTIPSVSVVKESMTSKDEADLQFGLKQNIDFVALSFVRSANDVVKLKQKIKRYLPKGASAPAVIVKVEKPEAIQNFDAILEECDGIMIARGDLGLESPIHQVPLHQKNIIRKCLIAAKPVITATEMLGSMQFNPRPTRAEVSDVANAVFDYTDAVMLSGETAMGRFPVRAIDMMSSIIRSVETSSLLPSPLTSTSEKHSIFAVAETATALAEKISAKAVIIATQSGFTARAVAGLRPSIAIMALSPNASIAQQLILTWGVESMVMDIPQGLDKTALTAIHKKLIKDYSLKKGDQYIVISGLKINGDTRKHSIQVGSI